jgi:hypothetical protein
VDLSTAGLPRLLGVFLGFGAAAGCGGGSGGATFGGTGAVSQSGGTGGSASGGKGGSGGSSAGDAGQGAGDSGASCPKLTACGGDVDGEWTASEACLVALNPSAEPGCEGAKSYSADVTGSYQFFASTKTLLTNVSITTYVTLDVDDTCARAIASGARTAADACPYLEAQKQADSSYVAASCAMQGALCHCVLETAPVTQNVANSYTLAGSQIIDSSGTPVDYCVDGDTLGIYAPSGDFGLTLWFARK